MNPYKVLRLGKCCVTKQDIKQAFRKLALQLHPDKHLKSSKAIREDSNHKFRQVSQAYEVLVDNTKRANYHLRHGCCFFPNSAHHGRNGGGSCGYCYNNRSTGHATYNGAPGGGSDYGNHRNGSPPSSGSGYGHRSTPNNSSYTPSDDDDASGSDINKEFLLIITILACVGLFFKYLTTQRKRNRNHRTKPPLPDKNSDNSIEKKAVTEAQIKEWIEKIEAEIKESIEKKAKTDKEKRVLHTKTSLELEAKSPTRMQKQAKMTSASASGSTDGVNANKVKAYNKDKKK